MGGKMNNCLNKSEKSLLSLEKILSACKGELVLNKNSENFYFDNVQTDSRNVENGSLFVPLVGEIQDGHKFVAQSVEKGATCVFINFSEYQKNNKIYDDLVLNNQNLCIIKVENTLHGLQNAAECYVEQFPNLIKVGITGSSGKTTTKEMVVSVLKQKFDVVYTQGNFNSETGLPLSVFKIRKNHEVGVFELGMNRENEIGEIAEVLKPKFAIITNIGSAHIGILKSRENIAKEKRKIFNYISNSGTAFIPFADDFKEFLSENVKNSVEYYGPSYETKENGVKFIKDCGLEGTEFSVDGIKICLKVPGIYNYSNALSAVALGKKLGVSVEKIKFALENFSNISGRLEIINSELKNSVKVQIIKDCYNANFESMMSVLKLCSSVKTDSKKIYVLADMLELGEKSEEIHRNIGKFISTTDFGFVIFYGKMMKFAFEEIVKNSEKCFYVEGEKSEAHKKIADKILEIADSGDLILFKGSHGMELEKVVEQILNNRTEKN